MKVHHLKCWPEYFQAVKSGLKPFEIRLNDRDYQVGDKLFIKEYLPNAELFSGEEMTRTITYITDWEQQDGYVVLGIPDQGEATRLREAIKEAMQKEWELAGEPTPVYTILHQALSHRETEDTGIQNVRKMYELYNNTPYAELHTGYQAGVRDTLFALGITIPGITEEGDKDV